MRTGRITDNFFWEEVTTSQEAVRKGLNNSLPSEIEPIVIKTAQQMETVRALLQAPILVSSWYRSPEVNKAVGGAAKSQHLSGAAVDFIAPSFGTPAIICKRLIKYPELLSFDQLIMEHTWVHISFSSDPTVKNKNQVLSLLESGSYSSGLTDRQGRPL